MSKRAYSLPSALIAAAWLQALWTSVCAAQAVGPDTQPFAPIYTDNQEYLADYATNVNNISLPLLQLALAQPNATDNATFTGYDWTVAYPGKSIANQTIHLRTAYDVALPESVVWNSSSTVTSLTFSVPNSMMSSATAPKAMDSSWYICRHIFVSPLTNITEPDHACNFLGSQCLSDLTTQLTATWGTEDPSAMCAGLAFDAIAPSCVDTFGFARMDVIAFNSATMAVSTQAQLMAVDEQLQYNWRIGTGFHNAGNPQVWLEALNRTYLVPNVFGYSNSSSTKSTPPVTFSCLQPAANASVPWNATATTSTTSTSTTTTSSTSITSSSTGTGTSATKSGTSSSQSTTKTTTTSSKTSTTSSKTTTSTGKVTARADKARDRQIRAEDLGFGGPQYMGLNL